MREEQKTSYPKMIEIEKIYQALKHKILFYSNLYIPDFIIYDLAEAMEEFYEENHN